MQPVVLKTVTNLAQSLGELINKGVKYIKQFNLKIRFSSFITVTERKI
jgi:hypothetical protein